LEKIGIDPILKKRGGRCVILQERKKEHRSLEGYFDRKWITSVKSETVGLVISAKKRGVILQRVVSIKSGGDPPK